MCVPQIFFWSGHLNQPSHLPIFKNNIFFVKEEESQTNYYNFLKKAGSIHTKEPLYC